MGGYGEPIGAYEGIWGAIGGLCEAYRRPIWGYGRPIEAYEGDIGPISGNRALWKAYRGLWEAYKGL